MAVKSGAKYYHEACYVCFTCQTPFGQDEAVGAYNVGGDLYCEPCAQEAAAHSAGAPLKNCCKCTKPPTKRMLSALEKVWHPECFLCTNFSCQTSLDGTKFLERNEKPYCKACFSKLFSEKCHGCNKPIEPDSAGAAAPGQCIKSGTRSFHEQCFVCATCKTTLFAAGQSQAYPVNEIMYCKTHAHEKSLELSKS